MAKTRADLIEDIAREWGFFYSSTVDSGSTTTIVDATLLEPDDFWIGHYAYITDTTDDAAPEAEERPVSDFVQSTGTVTVSPAFSAVTAAGDTYELLPARRADIIAGLDRGMHIAAQHWMVQVTDTTTVTIATDDYDYDLPTDLVRLNNVMYRADSDEPYQAVDNATWYVGGTYGDQVLYFYDISAFDAGDTVRLEYVKRIAEFSSDTDTLDVGAPAEEELVNFLVAYGCHYLHQMAVNRQPAAAEARMRRTLADDYARRCEGILLRAPRYRGAGRWHRPQRPGAKG